METTKIRWCDATWNVMTGCTHVSPGCDHCLDPVTPVLMADMSWKPIGKVQAGDEVVAFTEAPKPGQNRVYELATVEHVWTTTQPAVEITVDGQTIVASENHRFLAPWRPYWRQAQDLTLCSEIISIGRPSWLPSVESEPYRAGYVAGTVGGDGTMRIAGSGKNGTKSYMRVAVEATDHAILDRLAAALVALGCDHIEQRPYDGGDSGFAPATGRAPMSKVETRRMANLLIIDAALVERDNRDWQAGFLAGFLDTDGCYSGKNLRFNQAKDNGLLDLTARCIRALGFESVREDFRSTSGRSERLAGGLEEKIRFLSTIQPALTRKAADFYGRRFPSGRSTPVTGVRRIGDRELVDIQTSSGTFIAAGMATHNCYAEALIEGRFKTGFPNGFAPTFKPERIGYPAKWKRPQRIFVNSLSDVHHEDFPVDEIDAVYDAMLATDRHDYLVLTKRPQRMAAYFLGREASWRTDEVPGYLERRGLTEVPAQIWLGTSIESDRYTFRADHLRRIPTAGPRFISAEPLIGPLPSLDLTGIGWLIVGGESGNGTRNFRPMDHEWAIELQKAARAAGTAFFFKQSAGVRTETGIELAGEVIEEWPRPHPIDRHSGLFAVAADPSPGKIRPPSDPDQHGFDYGQEQRS